MNWEAEFPAVWFSWGQKQLALNSQLPCVYSQSLTLPTMGGIICNENLAKPAATMKGENWLSLTYSKTQPADPVCAALALLG